MAPERAAGAGSPADRPPPEIPGYEFLGELGRGGAGVVYHARHLTLNRPVAIKMLHPSLFPTEADRRRLRAEAEAVARLQHPNVVQLYEIGDSGGRPISYSSTSPGERWRRTWPDGRSRPWRPPRWSRRSPGRPCGPREADHPPGSEAGQHPVASRPIGGHGRHRAEAAHARPAVLVRGAEDHGFRAGQAARPERIGPDADAFGNAGLHVAGAGPGSAGRTAGDTGHAGDRCLRAGGDPI